MIVISSASATTAAPAQRSVLTPILAAVFAIDLMTALVVIAYGNHYLINTLNAPSSYPAFSLAIYGVVKLATAPIGGSVLDRVPGRAFVAAAFALEAGGIALILAVHNADAFLAGVGLLSTGIALAWLMLFHALGASTNPNERGAATASMGLVSITASGLGFGAAAVIGATAHWQVAFAIGLALAACSSALLFWVPVEPLAAPARAGPVPAPARSQGSRRAAGVIIFGHFTVVSGAIAALVPFLLRTLNISLLEAGVLLVPAGLAGAGAMFIAGRQSRHGRRLRELAVLYTLAAGSVTVMAGVDVLLFAVVSVPLAVALAGAQPLMNASLLDVARAGERTGSALGWLFFAEGLGSVAGPVAVGLAIEFVGVRGAVAGLGGSLLLLGAVAAAAAQRWRI